MKLKFVNGKLVAVGSIKQGDTTIEVNHEVEAEGVEVYTPDQRKQLFLPKKDFARRAESLKAKHRAELLQDDEFKTEALDSWGVKPGGENNQGDLTERLAAERQKWEQQHLTPLQSELQKTTGRITNLLRGKLHADIVSAAAQVGIKDEFLKPVGPKKVPLIINMLEPFFAHDNESDSWLVAEGDGFAFASKPSAEKTYKDVFEFVGEWGAENQSFLKETPRQNGPNVSNPNSPQTSQDLKTQIQEAETAGKFDLANQLKTQLLQSQRV